MEPIQSWSEERVGQWLQGLDAPLQQYAVSEWHLSGLDLLQLTSHDLEMFGVHKIGHQELILEAVEKLCCLTYGIGGENLRGLTERLRAVAHSLQMGIQNRWRVKGYDGQSATKLSVGILQLVVELITSAKGLFSLLNRYQFFQLSGHTSSKNIISYCRELGAIVHKDNTVYEKEKDIISVCRHLVAVCDEILTTCPEQILTHTAQLESVDLVPVVPGDQLGIEITSTGSSNHFVTGTAAECPEDFCEKIFAGDEVIQVNDQIVVGWSRANLVKKLCEKPEGVTLVLKKIPASLRRRASQPRQQQQQQQQLPSTQVFAQEKDEEKDEEEEDEEEEEDNPRHSIFERVAASVRSLSFRRAVQGPEPSQRAAGQEEPEVGFDRGLQGSQHGWLSLPSLAVDSDASPGSASPKIRRNRSKSPRSPSPQRSPPPLRDKQERASTSSCPDMVGHTGNKETKMGSTKGKSTAMSRRRVSCKELGRPDCDGWLWKKRKDSGVFITQKWQRFWFVLKGPSLYWYTSQQDEKAEGLVKVTNYNIESAGEHKRKYVFKICHQRFQTLIFAAENIGDMSKWIKCLLTATQKHTEPPGSEEECYSETESESEQSPSPGRKNKRLQASTLPRTKGKKDKVPLSNSPTGGSKGTDDEMGRMINNIKEGGVSLIGHEQPFTQDHFRKSFIRRNKNPVINEKVHALRVLQSTLKAKEAELQLVNKILDDPELSAATFRKWKETNEDFFSEIERLAALRAAAEGSKVSQDAPVEKVAAETVSKETAAAETEGAYRLSLSDGEQLVDAEPSDIQVEIPPDCQSTDSCPVLELSLGSLQDSINQELSEMAQSREDSYFYI